jgi:hypothetical protein
MNQSQALKILKTGTNVFLTGEPGSGKTHTVNRYIAYLRSHGIEPAITASTGIAATHIGGITIPSWSGIGIKNHLDRGDLRTITTNDYIKKRVAKTQVLIIDEVSMLSPRTLQMIEAICRKVKQNLRPFGGIQIVLVGDFFQLPPIVKYKTENPPEESLFEEIEARFAYDSPVWKQAEFTTCYITEQYRQDDEALLEILTKIRGNNFDDDSLKIISQRKTIFSNLPINTPKLYSHNIDVDSVNDQMLAKISGEPRFFPMEAKGHKSLVTAMKKGCLSPELLYLKIGASVMFTKNNIKEGFVNGTLGVIESFSIEESLPVVRIRSGRSIKVSYADWTVEEEGKVKGRLSQIPLRLAWAITVHKSQGISLDEAAIDLSKVFELGQGYVALSRVKRLKGIHILGWNKVAFKVDNEVLKKDSDFRLQSIRADKMFSRISETELKKMHREFIVLCGGEVDSTKVIPKTDKKISTYDETLKLWKKGKNLEQIAKTRKLCPRTIFSHLEKLVFEEKISRDEIMKIVPKDLLPDLSTIHAVFKKLNSDNLSPVFKHFQGEYSYDQLRFARIVLK